MRTYFSVITALLIVLVVAGLAWAHSEEQHGPEEQPAVQSLEEFIEDASVENGRQIYFASQNLNNQPIPFEEGPHWLYVHGGGCASCHEPDGKGGTTPMMCFIETPPVTYAALTADDHGADEGDHSDNDAHADSPSDSHDDGHAHAPYTIDAIRQALEQGVNPAGEELSLCMPRWAFSDDDYRDLLAFLVALDEQE